MIYFEEMMKAESFLTPTAGYKASIITAFLSTRSVGK